MAIGWLQKVAGQGHAYSKARLGFITTRVWAQKKILTGPCPATIKAGEHGSVAASYNLGPLYSEDGGLPKDAILAEQWSRTAAEKGPAEAQYDPGVLLYMGKTIKQTYAEAFKADEWYKKYFEAQLKR